MDSEFILNDLIAVERKLERLDEETQKGRRARKGRHRARDGPLRAFPEDPVRRKTAARYRDHCRRRKTLSGFGFLSRKPVLVVLNLAEGQAAPEITYPHQHSQVVALQAKLEMDIAQLPPDEKPGCS